MDIDQGGPSRACGRLSAPRAASHSACRGSPARPGGRPPASARRAPVPNVDMRLEQLAEPRQASSRREPDLLDAGPRLFVLGAGRRHYERLVPHGCDGRWNHVAARPRLLVIGAEHDSLHQICTYCSRRGFIRSPSASGTGSAGQWPAAAQSSGCPCPRLDGRAGRPAACTGIPGGTGGPQTASARLELPDPQRRSKR